MKTLILVSLLCFSVTVLIAQNDSLDMLHNSELLIHNNSTNSQRIRVRVYPVSMVFNGVFDYRLNADQPSGPPNPILYNFINARNTSEFQFEIISGSNFIGFNHDVDFGNTSTVGCVGFGMYNVEVHKWSNPNWLLVDTCLIDFDAGFPGSLLNDLHVIYRDDTRGIGGSGSRLTFYWDNCAEQNITSVSKYIKAWNQCSGQIREKEYGEMIYSTNNGNSYTKLPQDYRIDCGTENFPDLPSQWGTGVLTLNLTIDKNITTRYEEERFEAPSNIVISPECTLKINPSKIFRV